MSFFLFKWIHDLFANKAKWAAIGVTVTEDIQTVFKSPEVGFLAKAGDTLLNTKLLENGVDFVNKEIPVVLTAELAIEGLPDNPTADQIITFEKAALTAIGVKLTKDGRVWNDVAVVIGVKAAEWTKESDAGNFTWAKKTEIIKETFDEIKAKIAADALEDAANTDDNQ